MKLVVNMDFSWAHHGVTVEHFKKDALIETEDNDLIGVSLAEGWTRKPGKAPAPKAVAAAPENKAHLTAPENKIEPTGDAPVADQGAATGTDAE